MFLEVGIFDHHSLALTALKVQFIKDSPKMRFYCDYKNFNIEALKTELSTVLSLLKIEDYSSFQEIVLSVLHEQAPVNRHNNNPHNDKKFKKSSYDQNKNEKQL